MITFLWITILWLLFFNDTNNKKIALKYIALALAFYLGLFILISGPFVFLFNPIGDDNRDVMLYAGYAIGIIIFWLVYKGLKMLLRHMLPNKGLSNNFIYFYFLEPITLLIFGAVAVFWSTLSFGPALLATLISIIVWVVWMRKINNYVTYRCDNCREYPGDVSWIGKTKDGVKEERDHSTSDSRSTRDLGYGGVEIEDKTVNTHTTEYYQMYRNHYHCHLCNHRWSVQIKGEKIGRSVRKNTKTETNQWG